MEDGFNVRLHESYRLVVALCDSELKGRSLEEGQRVMDLSTPFFDGEIVTSDELKKMVIACNSNDATFYIVGERSVDFCVSLGLISRGSILSIDGIPYALVLL